MIRTLGQTNSILNRYIYELREVSIQTDRARFRRNLERIGAIFAYEISRELEYQMVQAQTPLGIAEMAIPTEPIVLATILRAGLPMHQGFLGVFDQAENAFISAYRKYSKDGTFRIQFEHLSCPSIEGKVLIIIDPMLATGASMVLSYESLLAKGKPRHTHIASVIASREGVEHTRRHLSAKSTTLWLGNIDDELTVRSYIVPGIGDSGDLAYGDKD